MNRIMIATDGSDGARAAVQEGVELASEVGADVTFVTVRHGGGSPLGDAWYQRRLTSQLARARTTLEHSPVPVMVVRERTLDRSAA